MEGFQKTEKTYKNMGQIFVITLLKVWSFSLIKILDWRQQIKSRQFKNVKRSLWSRTSLVKNLWIWNERLHLKIAAVYFTWLDWWSFHRKNINKFTQTKQKLRYSWWYFQDMKSIEISRCYQLYSTANSANSASIPPFSGMKKIFELLIIS